MKKTLIIIAASILTIISCGTVPDSVISESATTCGDDASIPETSVDTGSSDTGTIADTGLILDTGIKDTGAVDTGSIDTGIADTGSDVGTTDSGPVDSGQPGGVWQPHPGTSWQWQLSGTIDTSYQVAMYDIDMFDVSVSTIQTLHSRGTKVICYISAGTWENWRPDAASFPTAVKGNSNGWPGEKWLDVRSTVVQGLMSARMDIAVQKGCDGLEPDNVDGFSNSTGFPLTGNDQLTFNRFLASEAHKRGLSVALKNDVDQVGALVGNFDFMIDEECFKYSECGTVKPFIAANKAVFEVEYGSASKATTICPQANAANLDTLIKNLSLDATRTSCR